MTYKDMFLFVYGYLYLGVVCSVLLLAAGLLFGGANGLVFVLPSVILILGVLGTVFVLAPALVASLLTAGSCLWRRSLASWNTVLEEYWLLSMLKSYYIFGLAMIGVLVYTWTGHPILP